MVRKLVSRAFVALGLLGSLGWSAPAWGQLIAYDGFEDEIYSDGGPTLDGTPLQLTGPLNDFGNPPVSPGWVGPPSEPSPTSQKWVSNGTQNFLYDLGSLQNSAISYDNASTGKAEFLAYDNAGGVQYRSIRRVMDAYDPADTYYMSFFVQSSSVPTGQLGQRGQAMVGFTNNNVTEAAFTNQIGAGNIFGLMVGFDGRATDTRISDLVLRARQDTGGGPTAAEFVNTVLLTGETANPTAPSDQWFSTVENITHHVLLKLQINNDSGVDLVTYWVNPTNVGSEELATSSAQSTGSIPTLSMDLNNRITRLQASVSRFEDRSFFFDEPRFGYDFLSVVGPSGEEVLVGDYNDDELVNAADFTVWRDNLGGNALLSGDSSPGMVDDSDYANWQANFGGMQQQASSVAVTAIPEPAATQLVLLLLLGLLARTTLARK